MSDTKAILKIEDLTVSIQEKKILDKLNIQVLPGQVHAIMGKNGSGKSTLGKVLSRHPDYNIDSGNIYFENKLINEEEPHEIAREGIFLGFQYPIEIPGVTNSSFLRLSYNSVAKHKGLDELDPLEFNEFIQPKLDLLKIDKSFLDRGLNSGFSGGEKKRNEILQMAVLDPKIAVLDETDSGLDIDALKIVANGVNKLKSKDNATIVITHYQRLLDYIVPDFVHVLFDGKIVKSGTKELAHELEAKGYDWIKELASHGV